MLDIFSKILSSVVGQMKPDGGKLEKIEKDLFRKFDALETQARADNRGRWRFLFVVCAILGLLGAFAFRQFKTEVKSTVQERLDREFSSATLQKTVEDSAKKYTELNLKEYVERQLSAQYRVAKLEFMARQDSRKAFEELVRLAAEPVHKEDAEFSLSIIRKRYASLVYPFEAQGRLEAAEGAPLQLKLDPVSFSEAQIEALRPRLIQLAQESQKNYLVPDFIRFLKESDSLGASIGICRILAHNYGEKAGDYEFEKWIQYLETLDQNAVKIK